MCLILILTDSASGVYKLKIYLALKYDINCSSDHSSVQFSCILY